jgi:hypothetical protein
MASKRQNAPSEEADSCQVRSNALGAFERTHGRTQEQGSNACPAGPSGYLRSNARDLRSNVHPVSPSCHSSYLRSNVCLAFDHK